MTNEKSASVSTGTAKSKSKSINSSKSKKQVTTQKIKRLIKRRKMQIANKMKQRCNYSGNNDRDYQV